MIAAEKPVHGVRKVKKIPLVGKGRRGETGWKKKRGRFTPAFPSGSILEVGTRYG
jgi:hypothetical protein